MKITLEILIRLIDTVFNNTNYINKDDQNTASWIFNRCLFVGGERYFKETYYQLVEIINN